MRLKSFFLGFYNQKMVCFNAYLCKKGYKNDIYLHNSTLL